MSDDLDEIIEAHSEECGLGKFNYISEAYPLPCMHLGGDNGCLHPAYSYNGRGTLDIGCGQGKVVFIRKIDYLNWKMTDGRDH